MKTAYSLYYALSGLDSEVNAEDIEKNSDCGRLNLLCGCCFERVYWVSRNNQKFFSHFPGLSDNEKCEKYILSTESEKRKKALIGAINKEKAQYEKFFWQILRQCYPMMDKYSKNIKAMINSRDLSLAFEKFYYPVLKDKKQFLMLLLADMFNSKVEVDLPESALGKNYKIYKLVLRKNSLKYREQIVSLLFGFLMQKRSVPIVKELYSLSLLICYEQLNNEIPSPDQANNFAINLLLSLIVWIPWEECLNDIKCYGKVLPKHCYESNFAGFLIGKIETTNEEVNKCILTIN